MMRYYFDVRRDDFLIPDYEGMELVDLEAVREETAHAIADLARDMIRTSLDDLGHSIAIEARNENGPVLGFKLHWTIDRHFQDNSR